MKNQYDLVALIRRIKVEKTKKGYSNKDLSNLSTVPIGTLAKILGSETKDPQISNIIKIASALDVSADYLIFGEKSSNLQIQNDSPAEQVLIDFYNELNEEGQEKATDYIKDLVDSGNYKKHSKFKMVENE